MKYTISQIPVILRFIRLEDGINHRVQYNNIKGVSYETAWGTYGFTIYPSKDNWWIDIRNADYENWFCSKEPLKTFRKTKEECMELAQEFCNKIASRYNIDFNAENIDACLVKDIVKKSGYLLLNESNAIRNEG